MKNKKYESRAAEVIMDSLREYFKPHLGLSKARLNCFLMLVLAVIGQRTVSLVWLARHPHTVVKAKSVYRRFQRFFASCALPVRWVGALVLALVPKPADGWVLAVAFALSYQWGRKLEQESGIKLKSHGHRAKSVLRQGLESLHRMLHLPASLADRLADFLDHIVKAPLSGKIVVHCEIFQTISSPRGDILLIKLLQRTSPLTCEAHEQ